MDSDKSVIICVSFDDGMLTLDTLWIRHPKIRTIIKSKVDLQMVCFLFRMQQKQNFLVIIPK